MNRKPRILWSNSFCLLDTASGASISVREILHQLERRGFEVMILGATVFDNPNGVVRFGEKWESIKNSGKDFIIIEDGALKHNLVITKSTNRSQMSMDENNSLISNYYQALREFKPDLVFFYGGHPIDAFFPYEARIREIPSVAYLVNANYHGTRWCRDIDVIVTDTNATSQYYTEKNGFQPKVIGKFINPEDVISTKHERKHLTFVNPSWEKGAGLVALLALEMEKRRPDIMFEIVESRGNWLAVLKDVCAQFSYEHRHDLKNVIITKHTQNMKEVYGRSRVVLSPSLWWESGSRVLAEAMMNGIPAIVSDSGGNKEMVQGGGVVVGLPANCFKKPYNVLPKPEALDDLIKLIERYWDDEAYYISCINKAVDVGFGYHYMDKSVDRFLAATNKLFDKAAGDNDLDSFLKRNHKFNLTEYIPTKDEADEAKN